MRRHRLLLAVLFAAVGAATVAAITIPKVNFTDTRLKNGLRVIISSDRAAPVVSVAVAYNVGSRNERSRPDRFRASLRASDVQGIRERGRRRARRPHRKLRRQSQRPDRQGSHDLLRAGAVESARHGVVPRSRSHAVARDHAGERRQPARGGEGGAPAARRQPAVRPDVRDDRRAGIRELRQRALDHRLDGRSRCGVARRLRRVLQDLLRAQQRGARDFGRCRRKAALREGAKVFREHPVRAARRRSSIRPSLRRRKNGER